MEPSEGKVSFGFPAFRVEDILGGVITFSAELTVPFFREFGQLQIIDASVLVVSYNTRETTLDCIRSLARCTPRPREIIVIDNDSTDGSADAIQSEFPAVRVVRSEQNLGFGAANNLGAAQSTGDILVFLNPDSLVPPDFVEKMVTALAETPDAAIIGCRVSKPNGDPQPSCFRFPRIGTYLSAFPGLTRLSPAIVFPHYGPSEFDINSRFEPDFVSGCCFGMRARAFFDLGGFDENYFMYAEEADLCFRASQEIGKVVYLPCTTVVHIGSVSASSHISVKRLDYYLSHIYFNRKFYGKPRTVMVQGVIILILLAAFLGRLPAALRSGVSRNLKPAQELLLYLRSVALIILGYDARTYKLRYRPHLHQTDLSVRRLEGANSAGL